MLNCASLFVARGTSPVQKITPFLWFNDNAEEAVNFYTSIFKNSKIGHISHFPGEAPRRTGMVMTAAFQLEGQEFIALNGGPEFKFTVRKFPAPKSHSNIS